MRSGSLRLMALSAAILGGFAGTQASAALSIKVLSSAPQLVSGKEALLELSGVTDPPTVTVNERTSGDTTGIPGGHGVQVDFKSEAGDPTKQVGLVHSLQIGPNTVTVHSGRDSATITLVAHDINGTLFAGPQDTPFLCEIESFGLQRANSTDPQYDPLHARCPVVPKIAYYYRNTAGKWMPFDASAARPTDIDKGANGQAMIIRQEIGVLNRAAYVISIPHDPAAGPLPIPGDRGNSGWNGKLMYSFGPGAKPDGHHMGRGLGNLSAATQWVGDANGSLYWYIDHGYAIASSSLNSFGTTTDAVVSAESAYKVKEQFIKEFGPPMFTVGNGASGGSMQQQIIGNAYPGIIDGLVPSISFSDGMTFFQPIYDCELLNNVFKTGTWTKEQMDAVSGKYWGYCVSNATRYPGQKADNCDAAVEAMLMKFPTEVKPEDLHCTFQDDLAQVFGLDNKTGYGKSPWDNVGVQYGLKALNDGVITFDQFIDINKRVGGHDIDGKVVATRQVGDPDALRAAYATGQIDEYNGGNANIPILSTRYFLDDDPWMRGDANVDVHDRYHSAITQARMEKYNGNSNNYVQLLTASIGPTYVPNPAAGTPFNSAVTEGVAALDAWMTAIAKDTSSKPQAQKVVDNKPKDLVNACWTIDGKTFQDWSKADAPHGKVEKVTDWAKCNQLFPMHTDARIAAGAPMTDDILKCALKPIDAKDYKTAPTADQMTALKAVFPAGVCDWTKPGVGQDAKITTWAVFSDLGKWTALASN